MIDVYNMTGAEFRAYRQAIEMTQKAAAKELGTSERYIRKQEAAEHVAIIAARALRDRVMEHNARRARREISGLLSVYDA